MDDVRNDEAARRIRDWLEKPHGPFSWPVDACGYRQSIRYTGFRNALIDAGMPFTERELADRYASMLEAGWLEEIRRGD
jgi:hypothetical protein